MRSIDILNEKFNSGSFGYIELDPEDWTTVDRDLDTILGEIAGCSSAEDAAQWLDELGELQEILAKLRFKYDVPLSARLRQIVREFDRSDDHDLRASVFEKIKKGVFLSG